MENSSSFLGSAKFEAVNLVLDEGFSHPDPLRIGIVSQSRNGTIVDKTLFHLQLSSMDETQTAKKQESVRKLAEFLDSKFQLPFGLRIGWDGILGLIPGIGDVITILLSFFIILKAAWLGCPPAVILRMAINVIIDNLVDLIPFLGNFFDFFWKSNLKNVQLLDQYLGDSRRTLQSSRLVIALTILFLLGLFFALMAVVFISAKLAWDLFQNI